MLLLTLYQLIHGRKFRTVSDTEYHLLNHIVNTLHSTDEKYEKAHKEVEPVYSWE